MLSLGGRCLEIEHLDNTRGAREHVPIQSIVTVRAAQATGRDAMQDIVDAVKKHLVAAGISPTKVDEVAQVLTSEVASEVTSEMTAEVASEAASAAAAAAASEVASEMAAESAACTAPHRRSQAPYPCQHIAIR